MNKKIVLPLVFVVPFVISGCGTDAHYVQTGDKEQIISVGKINIQDYATAANAAVNDLLHSGALDRVAHPPAVIFVSPVINTTGQQIEDDLLTKKITKVLLDSGKALITATDPAAKDFNKEKEFLNDEHGAKLPDFTLSVKIMDTVDRAGNTHRSTQTFQLSLNDTKTSNQVWQGEKEIAKQGTRPIVGF